MKVDDGVGLNQYDLFLPHARYKHAGGPVSETKFVMFGGCARYVGQGREPGLQVCYYINI